MARRRFKRAGFNQKLIMDVGLAGIATRVLPLVVNKFFPLDQTLYAVVGAGGTYVVGSLMKKPDLANAGIALGLVELVAPMIESAIGGVVTQIPKKTPTGLPVKYMPAIKPTTVVDDYIQLNDYVPSGINMPGENYRHSYSSNVY